jgi:competence protein ComEA
VENSVVERAVEPDETKREHRAAATLLGSLTAVALFLSLRPAPPVIARPAQAPQPAMTVAAAFVVHVAGAVRSPGVYELPPGSRVADAIEAAGGARPRADLSLLNLAEPVQDGMQILVMGRGETAAVAVATPSTPAETVIDLNSADQTALEAVPGIGPVKAAAIIATRTELGAFASVEQLLEVSGIGPATLEAIRPYITI